MNIFQTNNRILGQPTFLSEGQDEKEDKKAAKKALNEMNKTQNLSLPFPSSNPCSPATVAPPSSPLSQFILFFF